MDAALFRVQIMSENRTPFCDVNIFTHVDLMRYGSVETDIPTDILVLSGKLYATCTGPQRPPLPFHRQSHYSKGKFGFQML